jgi:hypothetical protein
MACISLATWLARCGAWLEFKPYSISSTERGSMRRDDSSPEAYSNDVEGDLRMLLEAIRDLILEVVPDVEEGIGHGMLDYPGLANLAA